MDMLEITVRNLIGVIPGREAEVKETPRMVWLRTEIIATMKNLSEKQRMVMEMNMEVTVMAAEYQRLKQQHNVSEDWRIRQAGEEITHWRNMEREC